MEGRDAATEAIHAADQAVADDALRRRASTREIARELGVAPSTVREYLGRAAAAGIGWPLAANVTDESLMARLFVNAGVRAGARFHAESNWSALVRELKRPGVNLLVPWEEYRAVHPEGYAYSRYLRPKLCCGCWVEPCKAYRAKTKGKVERPFRYIREDFFLGRSFRDRDDLNSQFRQWLD